MSRLFHRGEGQEGIELGHKRAFGGPKFVRENCQEKLAVTESPRYQGTVLGFPRKAQPRSIYHQS